MQEQKIIAVRDFGYCDLAIAESGKIFLVFKLNQKQLSFLGQKLHALTCFKRANLCERKLRRPHFTCFFCKLLKVVNQELPLVFEIKIAQIWCLTNRSTFRNLLSKNAISFAEAIS